MFRLGWRVSNISSKLNYTLDWFSNMMAAFSLKRSSSHLKMDVGRLYYLLKGGENDSIFSAVWQFQDRMVSSANRLLDVLFQHAPWWFHRKWYSSSLKDRSKEKHDLRDCNPFIPATTREGWRVWHFMACHGINGKKTLPCSWGPILCRVHPRKLTWILQNDGLEKVVPLCSF